MNIYSQKGSTLIELMTAIFVLVLSLVGALALTTTGIRNQGIGLARVKATQLAREGLEVSRAIRDSNWLAGRDWDSFLGIGGASASKFSCAVLPDSDVSLEQPLEPLKFIDVPCQLSLTDPVFHLSLDAASSTGAFYQTGVSAIDDETLLDMFRRIRIDAICPDGLDEKEGVACPLLDDRIGVKVTSEVSWKYGNRAYTTTLIEKLYNWH